MSPLWATLSWRIGKHSLAVLTALEASQSDSIKRIFNSLRTYKEIEERIFKAVFPSGGAEMEETKF